MKKLFVIALLALPFCACATISGGGGRQTVNLMTNDGKQANAKVINGANIYTTVLPTALSIKRTGGLIAVNVEGNETTVATTTNLAPHVNGWFWANISSGGALGSSTDLVTGAAWKYDDNAIINVQRK